MHEPQLVQNSRRRVCLELKPSDALSRGLPDPLDLRSDDSQDSLNAVQLASSDHKQVVPSGWPPPRESRKNVKIQDPSANGQKDPPDFAPSSVLNAIFQNNQLNIR